MSNFLLIIFLTAVYSSYLEASIFDCADLGETTKKMKTVLVPKIFTLPSRRLQKTYKT
jgi:hypothetical protein